MCPRKNAVLSIAYIDTTATRLLNIVLKHQISPLKPQGEVRSPTQYTCKYISILLLSLQDAISLQQMYLR